MNNVLAVRISQAICNAMHFDELPPSVQELFDIEEIGEQVTQVVTAYYENDLGPEPPPQRPVSEFDTVFRGSRHQGTSGIVDSEFVRRMERPH